MTMTQAQQDLKAFMAIAQASAVEEAKLMPTTLDIKKRARALAEFARDQLAAQARAERAKRPSNVVSGAIRAAIQAMSREQIIARLTELRVLHPDLQFAHRDYDMLTDVDLRSALEDAESLVERGE
jgi:hypothetical protein